MNFNKALLIAIISCLVLSCSEDCPVCDPDPQPYRGYVYMSDYVNRHIYQIETETDSLVDSIACPAEPGYMGLSQDGRYLGVTYFWGAEDPKTIIYDAQTLQPLHELDQPANCYFLGRDDLMLTYRSDTLFYRSLPDFNVIDTDSVGLFLSPALDRRRGIIYGKSDANPANPDSSYLIGYDYINRRIADTWHIEDDQGGWFFFGQAELNRKGSRMYLVGNTRVFPYSVICFDPKKRSIIWSFSLSSNFGWAELSPDEQELYVVDPGWSYGGTECGTLFILDANTGDYLHGISLYGFYEDSYLPLQAWTIAITPTGDKAYVGTGGLMMGSGSLLVVDTKTREVTKLIWPDLRHFSYQVVIGPKL